MGPDTPVPKKWTPSQRQVAFGGPGLFSAGFHGSLRPSCTSTSSFRGSGTQLWARKMRIRRVGPLGQLALSTPSFKQLAFFLRPFHLLRGPGPHNMFSTCSARNLSHFRLSSRSGLSSGHSRRMAPDQAGLSRPEDLRGLAEARGRPSARAAGSVLLKLGAPVLDAVTKRWKDIPLANASWLPWFTTRFIRSIYPFCTKHPWTLKGSQQEASHLERSLVLR